MGDEVELIKCVYCDAEVRPKRIEYDHFPIPRRYGGESTVPCCPTCHDMKDRIPIDGWPQSWIEKVLADFPKLSRETRIFLAKAVVMAIGGRDARV